MYKHNDWGVYVSIIPTTWFKCARGQMLNVTIVCFLAHARNNIIIDVKLYDMLMYTHTQ